MDNFEGQNYNEFMEDFEPEEQPEVTIHLGVDDYTLENLKEMAKWAKTVASAVIVCLVSLIIFAVLLVMIKPNYHWVMQFGHIGFIMIFVVFSGICLYPAIALFNFSNTLIGSITRRPHQGQFNMALDHLRSMFKYTGVLLIFLIIVVALAIIVWAMI